MISYVICLFDFTYYEVNDVNDVNVNDVNVV